MIRPQFLLHSRLSLLLRQASSASSALTSEGGKALGVNPGMTPSTAPLQTFGLGKASVVFTLCFYVIQAITVDLQLMELWFIRFMAIAFTDGDGRWPQSARRQ